MRAEQGHADGFAVAFPVGMRARWERGRERPDFPSLVSGASGGWTAGQVGPAGLVLLCPVASRRDLMSDGLSSVSPKQKEVVQALTAAANGAYSGRHRCNGGTHHPHITVSCRL
jgi:hypothetical protein